MKRRTIYRIGMAVNGAVLAFVTWLTATAVIDGRPLLALFDLGLIAFNCRLLGQHVTALRAMRHPIPPDQRAHRHRQRHAPRRMHLRRVRRRQPQLADHRPPTGSPSTTA